MDNRNNTAINETEEKIVRLPEGQLCGHNCADGCIYWVPQKRDSNGRQYCSHYDSHYYPSERQGCLSFDNGR